MLALFYIEAFFGIWIVSINVNKNIIYDENGQFLKIFSRCSFLW